MGNDVGSPIDSQPKAFGAYIGSPRMCMTGGVKAQTGTDGTDTTPVVTETYLAELEVTPACVATGVSLLNGSAVAGNVVAILYNSKGTPVATSALAGVAQAGAAVYQRFPFTRQIKLAPGTYYVGVQFNNTGARFRAIAFGDFGQAKKTGEVFGVPTTVTPPTTFTANQGPIAALY